MLVRLFEQLGVCTESVDAHRYHVCQGARVHRHHICQGAGVHTLFVSGRRCTDAVCVRMQVSGWSLARPHRGLNGLVVVAFYKEKPEICLVEVQYGERRRLCGPMLRHSFPLRYQSQPVLENRVYLGHGEGS